MVIVNYTVESKALVRQLESVTMLIVDPTLLAIAKVASKIAPSIRAIVSRANKKITERTKMDQGFFQQQTHPLFSFHFKKKKKKIIHNICVVSAACGLSERDGVCAAQHAAAAREAWGDSSVCNAARGQRRRPGVWTGARRP